MYLNSCRKAVSDISSFAHRPAPLNEIYRDVVIYIYTHVMKSFTYPVPHFKLLLKEQDIFFWASWQPCVFLVPGGLFLSA